MVSKQQFLPEKLSKYNSILHSGSMIDCQIKDIVRQNYAPFSPRHHSLMAPCKITQFYDQFTVELDFWIPSVLLVHIEHIVRQSVQKNKLVNTEFYASRKRIIIVMTANWMGKRTYVSPIHMAIVTTMYWISLLRPSPVIWQLWPCSHALHGLIPEIRLKTQYVCLRSADRP